VKRRVLKKRLRRLEREARQEERLGRGYHKLASIKVGVARMLAAIDGTVGHE
jgi:hypothetical protein